MSISIYYTAVRAHPLNENEAAQISTIVEQYSVDDQIEAREQSGEGPNWESFCIYDPADPSEPNNIFEGATKLPDNSEEAVWVGVQHWCQALSAIRNVLADAKWEVRIDDHIIPWDDASQGFDPSG